MTRPATCWASTEAEAERLFNGENDLEDVVRVALEIADAHYVPLGLPEEVVALADNTFV